MADITLQAVNNLKVTDGSDSVAVLNKSITIIDQKEYTRNKEILNPAAIPVPFTLDYSGITTPKYIKLFADWFVNLTIWAVVITNVTSFEFNGDVPTIIVTNTSTTDKVVIDYVVLGS